MSVHNTPTTMGATVKAPGPRKPVQRLKNGRRKPHEIRKQIQTVTRTILATEGLSQTLESRLSGSKSSRPGCGAKRSAWTGWSLTFRRFVRVPSVMKAPDE